MVRTAVQTLVVLSLGMLAAVPAADAQAPPKVPRIGFLDLGSPSVRQHYLEALRQGLRDLGYAEGKNIALESRWAEERTERLPDLAAELVRLRVDVIVTATTQGTLATKRATGTIPIVMALVSDPVGSGVVASLARPGGNITGLSIMHPEVTGKRLQLLKEAVPKLSRAAVLWNSSNPSVPPLLRETEAAARALGVQLQRLEVRAASEFDGAFSAMSRDRAGALMVLPDALFSNQRKRVVDLAAKNRLPAMYWTRDFVDAGGLMTYGPNLADLFRRAATYVDKILKGAKPADLPVEQPTRFELIVNMKTAKALGLTIPQSILVRADQVIQ
jgi:putative ABC transport system substrate-binding protein